MVLPDVGQKMFIDPMNYGDAETALKEFANEIDPASLALERLIGGGRNLIFLFTKFTAICIYLSMSLAYFLLIF